MRSNAWITSLNIWSSFAKLLVQQYSRYLSIKLVALPHQTGGAKRQTAKTLEVLKIRKKKKLTSCLDLLLSTNLAWCREKPGWSQCLQLQDGRAHGAAGCRLLRACRLPPGCWGDQVSWEVPFHIWTFTTRFSYFDNIHYLYLSCLIREGFGWKLS